MDSQKRFILAMVLSALVIFGWQAIFAPPPPQVPADVPVAKTADVTTPATPPAAPNIQAVEPSFRAVPVSSQSLTGQKFHVDLTNQGAALKGIKITIPEQYQKAGDLLADFPKDAKQLPFRLGFEKGAIALPKDLVWEVAGESTGDRVIYRWADATTSITKTFTINAAHPYTLDMQVAIANLGTHALVDQMSLLITATKDASKEKSFLDFRPDEAEAICRVGDDTERELYSSLEETKSFVDKPVAWGGVNTRYFMWSSIPQEAATGCIISKKDGVMTTKLTGKEFSIAPGTTHTTTQMLYLGPKDLDVLTAIGSDLQESVDYGILTILAKPLRYVLNLFQSVVHNWGLAIILLTLLIKILTWPLTEKSYANAERMKLIQPKLEAVRKTYENDQQRLAEETMKLFKQEGHNPLGGCLPMLVQMPILYGLYVMIINSVELYQAPFILWYTDLSSKDPYFVLPILMGVVMVVQQQFMSAVAPNPQTKIMMRVMPIMFTAFMLFLPSGLVLYYFLNLLLGVLQQWLIRRKFERQALVTPA